MSAEKSSLSALLIVNARSGTADRALEPAVAQLAEGGIDVELASPDEPSAIDEIIAQRADGFDMLILGGGDGTISASTSAVLAAGKPLGVLPMGTANDFARSLAIPFALEDAAAVIVAGHRRHVDVGLMNERPFLNVASVGFSVDVARFHTGERKKRLKLISYVVSWYDAYRVHRPFRTRLTLDGRVLTPRCAQLAVGSGRHYGGGLTLSEDAQPDDGFLHVYYIEPVGLLGGLRLLPALRFGTLKRAENAELLKAKDVRIETRRARRINVDGELAGSTPARFAILPGALTVFAPPPAHVGAIGQLGETRADEDEGDHGHSA